MVEKLIFGVIYSRFDEKVGPDAIAWTPSTLSYEIKNVVSLKSLNLLAGEKGRVSEDLAIIPIASLNLKGLVKAFEVKSKTHRRGACDSTLTLLFNEESDLIYYKHIKNFEAIFNEAIVNIKKHEETGHNSELIKETISNFFKNALITLSELRDAELSSKEEVAFPVNGIKEVTKGYLFKIIVCGDPAVGKTSIILRFTDRAFRRTYIPTLGVNICEKTVFFKNAKINFIIWDIAGHGKFLKMRKHFYQNADGEILVFDLTKNETLKNIHDWFSDIKKHVETDVRGILLGNKSDLVDLKKLDREEIFKLQDELNLTYVETSALTGENVEEAFLKLSEILYENSRDLAEKAP